MALTKTIDAAALDRDALKAAATDYHKYCSNYA